MNSTCCSRFLLVDVLIPLTWRQPRKEREERRIRDEPSMSEQSSVRTRCVQTYWLLTFAATRRPNLPRWERAFRVQVRWGEEIERCTQREKERERAGNGQKRRQGNSCRHPQKDSIISEETEAPSLAIILIMNKSLLHKEKQYMDIWGGKKH